MILALPVKENKTMHSFYFTSVFIRISIATQNWLNPYLRKLILFYQNF